MIPVLIGAVLQAPAGVAAALHERILDAGVPSGSKTPCAVSSGTLVMPVSVFWPSRSPSGSSG
jgi:hypothetical protein